MELNPLILLIVEKTKGSLSSFPIKRNIITVSFDEAIEYLKTMNPDVIFMDINTLKDSNKHVVAIRQKYQGIIIVVVDNDNLDFNVKPLQEKMDFDDFIFQKDLNKEYITRTIVNAAFRRDFKRIINKVTDALNIS